MHPAVWIAVPDLRGRGTCCSLSEQPTSSCFAFVNGHYCFVFFGGKYVMRWIAKLHLTCHGIKLIIPACVDEGACSRPVIHRCDCSEWPGE